MPLRWEDGESIDGFPYVRNSLIHIDYEGSNMPNTIQVTVVPSADMRATEYDESTDTDIAGEPGAPATFETTAISDMLNFNANVQNAANVEDATRVFNVTVDIGSGGSGPK